MDFEITLALSLLFTRISSIHEWSMGVIPQLGKAVR